MPAPRPNASFIERTLRLSLAALLVSYNLVVPGPVFAGGALIYDSDAAGTIFTWDTTAPVPYRADGGNLGTLNSTTTPTPTALVNSMFQVWTDVPTAKIAFQNAGAIQNVADGDVNTAVEFNAIACPQGATQNPIVFDADGSLFTDLGFSSGVIGFAGPGLISLGTRRITCGLAALNGKFIDGNPGNLELTLDEFSAAFIHEFGHFSGLDHSQINADCLLLPGTCVNNDDAFGVPTMFPILLSSATEGAAATPAQKTLAMDDISWISTLYPETASGVGQTPYSSVYGTLLGTVFFSDGVTQAQGVNVIARDAANPRRNAVSVVSGHHYTANRGQPVTGDNTAGSNFGSRDISIIGQFDIPVPGPASYTAQGEGILAGFTGGSGVGPFDPAFPLPGGAPAPTAPVAVTAGNTSNVTGGIVLFSTPFRFDAFESTKASPPDPMPFLLRKQEKLEGRAA